MKSKSATTKSLVTGEQEEEDLIDS